MLMQIIPWIGLGLLGVYEVYAALIGRPFNTISQFVWSISNHPIVPFMFGLLMSHFFWRR